ESFEINLEESDESETVEWVWDAEDEVLLQDSEEAILFDSDEMESTLSPMRDTDEEPVAPEVMEAISTEPLEVASAEVRPDADPQTSGFDVWALESHVFDEVEQIHDHYAGLAAGRSSGGQIPQSPDWDKWDPLVELRLEEEAFAIPQP